ncbi:hypothetical protein SAMN04489812_5819 [Microlunatus soli]|uniref:Transposase n=1 Tax=Microlunatus soli TaxID=630515 RepID=A0A1H2ABS7_9ACTN|nr:hypothetical protein SAMN04489812_5819 [Microlunatus soli]
MCLKGFDPAAVAPVVTTAEQQRLAELVRIRRLRDRLQRNDTRTRPGVKLRLPRPSRMPEPDGAGLGPE